MTRNRWHLLLVTIVVVLLALAIGFYVTSIVLAPQGRDVAGLFDGWAMFAVVGAIAFGIVDFFVRPHAGRSGSHEERDAAADDRIRNASVRERSGH